MPTIATTLRVVDTSGVELLKVAATSNPSVIHLNSVDLGFPTMRETSTPLTGAHGETDTTQWFGARAITATLTMPQRPLTDSAVDTIQGLLNPSRRVWLYVQRPDWPSERRILVRGQTFTCPPAVMRVAQAGWIAPAGLLEDAAESTVTLVASATAGGGFAFPLSFPLTFSSGLVPGASIVAVSGNIDVPPVIDIFGPCSDPLVRCVDTGAQISFTGLSIADGDFLRVDMAARTANLNADPAQSRYSRLDFTTSTWWSLPAGLSVQVVFSPNAPSGACQAVLRFHSRWI